MGLLTSVTGTLDGASIIGKLPARPFVTPRAELNVICINCKIIVSDDCWWRYNFYLNMKAGVSPAMTGLDRGAQHNNSNGMSTVRIPDNRINCRLNRKKKQFYHRVDCM